MEVNGPPFESPNASGDNVLFGVSCTSPTFCKAVGQGNYGLTTPITALVESWNGSNWSIDPTPNSQNTFLNFVSCASDKSCMATGEWLGVGVRPEPVEAWNGNDWTTVPGPSDTGSTFVVACGNSMG